MPIKLNLPDYSFSISETNGKKVIFDQIRKKQVALTPEEWVRQNFIQFLIKEKGYPASLIAIETKVIVNGLKQRADIVCYNTKREPLMVIECKAPEVKITQHVFEQVTRYNSKLKTKMIVVTNGLNHYCAQIQGLSYSFLKDIPVYNAQY